MGGICPKKRRAQEESLLHSELPVRHPSILSAAPITAQEALDSLKASYEKLAALSLPAGGAGVLADLQKNIRELQGLIQGAKVPVSLPWSRPLPEDQEQYEAKCPEGGLLLRKEVCVAAEGHPAEEYAMGVIFISDRGILFEGGGGLSWRLDQEVLDTGLVKWTDIMAIEHRGLEGWENNLLPSFRHKRTRSVPRGMTLTIKGGRITYLHLQLSISQDCDSIEETWRVCSGHTQVSPGALGDTEVDASFQFHSVAVNEGEMQSSALRASGPSPVEQVDVAAERPRSMTVSFKNASEDLPDDGAAGGTLVLEETWTTVPLQQIRMGLDADDWTMNRMIMEKLRPENFVSEPPVRSPTKPGLVFRRICFLLTLPQDVPRAVASLVGSPEKSNITQVIAYRASDDELSVVLQSITHDVPFGQDFRVQEMYSWKSLPTGGGVKFQCWSQVVWTTQLPWTHGILKSFIAKKAAAESKECAQILSRIIQAKDEA